MKLSKKLVLLSVILTMFSIIIGFMSIVGMSNINNDVKDVSANWLPTIRVVGELESLIGEYRRNELIHIVSNDKAVMAEYEAKLKNLSNKIDAKIKEGGFNLQVQHPQS